MSFDQVKQIVADYKKMGQEPDEWDDLAEFDAPFKEPSAAASLFVRQHHLTRKIEQDNKTELNNKQISIEVQNCKI